MQPPQHVQRNRLQHGKHIYLCVLLIYFSSPVFSSLSSCSEEGKTAQAQGAAVGQCPLPAAISPMGFLLKAGSCVHRDQHVLNTLMLVLVEQELGNISKSVWNHVWGQQRCC